MYKYVKYNFSKMWRIFMELLNTGDVVFKLFHNQI